MMRCYIALLGSINVGGNRLLMADLRHALEREDFCDVETVVASGNVFFTHEECPSEGLAEKLNWVMREEFDMNCLAIVLTRDELAAAIADSPYDPEKENGGEEKLVHISFFANPIGAHQLKALMMDHQGRGGERIAAAAGGELGSDAASGAGINRHWLHIDYAQGVGSSRLTGDFIARRLGQNGTARNLRSLKRILHKFDAFEPGE